MWCNRCGKIIVPDTNYCEECEAIISAGLVAAKDISSEQVARVDSEKDTTNRTSENELVKTAKEKNRKIKPAIWVALAMILVIGIGLFVYKITNPSPVGEIMASTAKTIVDGGKFTLKINGGEYEGFYFIDDEKEIIEVFAGKGETSYAFLLEEDEMGYYSTFRNWDSYFEFGDAKSVSRRIPWEIDGSVLLDFLEEASEESLYKINYERYFEQLGFLDLKFEKYIEDDNINDAVKACSKALEKNAEDCLGYYSSGKTKYYDIDVNETLDVCLEAVKPYLKNDASYKLLKDKLAESEIGKTPNIEIEVEYDGRYLSSLDFEINRTNFKLSFDSIGECEERLDEGIRESILNATMDFEIF